MKRFLCRFSMKKVPQVDLTSFLLDKKDNAGCDAITSAFQTYGCVAVKDPRVTFQDNESFIDLIEKYFIKRGNHYYKTGQLLDCYPEKGYNVGLTPENTEKAKKHTDFFDSLSAENKPVSPLEPTFDAKWRYIFPVGKSRDQGKNKELDPDHENPLDFPEFTNVMSKWGNQIFATVNTVSEMAALGLGFPVDFFTQKIEGAHNILAPTASDLIKNKKGAILAGAHYDFNFVTIHGKSRYPGLYIWLRTGERVPVSIPDGFLLLQSGRQFEIITGGHIFRGMHEVVYDENLEKKVQAELARGKTDIWRISSTMFVHFASDVMISPQGKFDTPEARKKYPPISSYDLKIEELSSINLLKK